MTITATSELWLWSGGTGSWHFLTIPEELTAELRAQTLARRSGFGSVRVVARIAEVEWRTSVFPQKSGGYLLPVKADVRRRAGIGAGDLVTVEIELA